MKYNLEEIYHTPNKFSELLDLPGPLIYRIWNSVTGKSYIGITKVNLRNRLFTPMFGHFFNYESDSKAHLYNSMRKYGLFVFFIEVLSTNPDDKEEQFITEYDSFHNGYNGSKTGLPFNEGSAVEGKIYVNKGGTSIYIKPEELNKFLNDGWNLGRGFSTTEGYIRVFNFESGHATSVSTDKLQDYLDNGYQLGINWETTSGKWEMNKDGKCIMVDPNEVEKYKGLGYELGRGYSPTSGLSWITNGVVSMEIKPEDIDKYPGFHFGSRYQQNLDTVWMHHGTDILRVPKDKVDEYLAEGYKLGQGRFAVVNSNNECHRISISQVLEYHSKGYQKGRYWHSSYPLTEVEEFKHLFSADH